MPEAQYDKEASYVQTVLETVVLPEERSSGFVQRNSKVNGVRFVQMLVLACLGRADVTLSEMVAVGAALGVRLTTSALHQRIGPGAVRLLAAVLAQAIQRGLGGAAHGCALFAHFSAAYLHDSRYLAWPDSLAAAWRGSGGSAAAAGAKLWLSFEYLSGCFAQLRLGPGVEADQGSQLPAGVATPGRLHLFDLGFFSQYLLAALAAAGSFFVCRLQYQTALATPEGERLELEKRLRHCPDGPLDPAVRLGATVQLPVRLLCQRVPQAVADPRRAQAKAAARRRGTTLAPLTWRLLAGNLFCPHVPAAWWGRAQVLAVYTLRWQSALLLKLFKSQAGLDQLGPWRSARVLCQLYARLLGLVIVQRRLGPLRFTTPRELSLPKALRLVQQGFVPQLSAALAHGGADVAAAIRVLVERCRRLALKDRRKKDPSTYDFLLNLGV